MFFVSKKKYNKMIHQYEEEKKELIRQLNDVSDEKTELQLRYDCLKSDRINAGDLLKQNNKLIDWINKILTEVGTCRVNNVNTFRIPVLYNYHRGYDDSPLTKYDEEYLIIPQIEIVKLKYERIDANDERCDNKFFDNVFNNRNNLDS